MDVPAVLLGAATAVEDMPQGQARPIQRSWEKMPLSWCYLGHQTPASSTQRSVSWLGVEHPLTAPSHGWAGLCLPDLLL